MSQCYAGRMIMGVIFFLSLASFAQSKQIPIEMISITAPGPEAKAWIGSSRRAWTIREALRLGSGFESEPNWSKMPNLCLNTCPQYYSVNDTAGPSELHLIGVYEALKPQALENGTVPEKGIKVRVQPTAKPVILMLTSYERALWEIEAAPGSQLKEIWLGGYQAGKILKSPKGIPVKAIPEKVHGIDPKGREGNSGAVTYLNTAKSLTGQNITSFQGDYTGIDFVVPLYGDKTIFSEIRQLHSASLKNKTIQTLSGSFPWVDGKTIKWVGKPPFNLKQLTVALPANARLNSITYSPANGKYFGSSDHEFFVIDSLDGSAKKIEPPARYPRMTWLSGVAYEPQSGQVFIASRWHAGHHHTFNPITNEWRVFDISAGGGGFNGISYDASSKRILAVRQDQIMAIDTNFKPSKLVSFQNEQAQIAGLATASQMAVTGDWILIQAPSVSPPPGVQGKKFMIHKNSGEIREYKGDK